MGFQSNRGDAPGAPANQASSSGRPKLLLVEDDADTQMMMRIILQNDFELEVAANGAAVREAFRKHRTFDAVLMDISLHGDEDGLQLTKLIRGTSQYRELPIVALTAHASMEHQQLAIEAGCNAVLMKPAKRAKLLATLTQIIRRESDVSSAG